MIKKSIHRIFILMIVTMLALATTVFAANVDWNKNYITVTGFGAPPTGVSPGQARAMARRAAVIDGYRQMAEIINGVQVDSETTVSMAVVENDIIKTKVNGLIKGAKVVSERSIQGGYEVTMSVPIFGVSNSLASSVLQPSAKKEAFPLPSISAKIDTPAPSIPSGSSAASPRGAASFNIQKEGTYTGVVIDCRGLGLGPVMSPVIKNAEGQSIYGYKNLDYDYVVSKGMAGYIHTEGQSSRAGGHPLTLRAVSVDRGANPVLSMEDADKMLLENQASHFLDNTNVLFMY